MYYAILLLVYTYILSIKLIADDNDEYAAHWAKYFL